MDMGFDILNNSVLFALGFALGMLTGTFGVGGGFLITPALNIIGLDVVSAIGTSFATLAGNSVFGVWTHCKLGNVDWKLGVTFGLCSLAGVELGRKLLFHLQRLGLAGTGVRASYILLLTILAILMARDYLTHRGGSERDEQGKKEVKQGNRLLQAFRKIVLTVPPFIFMPRSKVKLSAWVVIGSSVSLGLLSGFMGIGGGVVSLPLFIYLLGIPTLTAIGTTVLSVSFASLFGTIAYAVAGNVQWVTALLLIAGSVGGVHVGGHLTKYVHEIALRGVFSLLLLAVSVSVLLKQLGIVIPSAWTLFGSTAIVCLMLLYKASKNYAARNRGDEA
jgi:uncharacterized protein